MLCQNTAPLGMTSGRMCDYVLKQIIAYVSMVTRLLVISTSKTTVENAYLFFHQLSVYLPWCSAAPVTWAKHY